MLVERFDEDRRDLVPAAGRVLGGEAQAAPVGERDDRARPGDRDPAERLASRPPTVSTSSSS
ncbi:hypothetical protein SF12_07925 [Streptomyces sp. MBRL 601]|nr:hypothetical protein SF12_07925 [Streptomyces sp. MBRL 601]